MFELGDYSSSDISSDIYDYVLAIAVSNFQHRNGLEIDGILGKKTAQEINKSVKSRTLQLEVNLQRAKQLSEFGDKRYILVNIPEYKYM